jgi:hypothetical protein
MMYYLSSVYFVNQPLHISGIFVAHQEEKWNKTNQETKELGNITRNAADLL